MKGVVLRPAIRTSQRLAGLKSDTARLFYTWLLTAVDSHGCHLSNPALLNASVWPLLGHTAEETLDCLLDCEAAGLLRLFDDGEHQWLELPDWDQKAGADLRRRGARSFGPTTEECLLSGVWRREKGQGIGIGTGSARAREDADLVLDQSGSSPGLVLDQSGTKRKNRKEGIKNAATAAPAGKQRAFVQPESEVSTRGKPLLAHQKLVEHWQASWAETRLGTTYEPAKLDWVAAAAVLKLAKGDLATACQRADRLLRSNDPWLAANASLALLQSRWNQLAVEVVRLSESQRQAADIAGVFERFHARRQQKQSQNGAS